MQSNSYRTHFRSSSLRTASSATALLFLLLVGTSLAPHNVLAQIIPSVDVVPEPTEQAVEGTSAFELESTTIQRSAEAANDIQAPSVSASDGASDYTITVSFSVTQNCLFAESNTVSVVGVDNNTGNTDVSWSKTYSDGYLTTRTGTLTWNVGPSESHNYRLSVRNRGGLGCDNTEKASNNGSTSALKAPVNVAANANGSDKNVTITWGAGTNITDTRNVLYYRIYKNGAYIALRGKDDRAYVAATTPGSTDTWGVATYFSGYTTTPARVSSVIGRDATTEQFKTPTNLSASNGTTVRSIELDWNNPSDYATALVVYRDGEELATVAAQADTYLDQNVVPGEPYDYCVLNRGPQSEVTAQHCSGSAGRSFFVRADDGSQSDNVRVDWTLTPTELSNVTNIQVLRNGQELDVKNPSSTTYTDLLADAGSINKYEIVLRDATNNVVLSDYDYGFVPPNGIISGSITTEGVSSGGVRDVLVTASPSLGEYLYALQLDGTGDYMRVDHRDDLSLGQSYTIELWLKPDELRDQTVFAKGQTPESAPFGLNMNGDGSLTYWARSGATSVSSSPLVASTWTHVAIVQDESLNQLRLYVGGQLASTETLSGADGANHVALTFGANEDGSSAFSGSLDDIRLWTLVRTAGEIDEGATTVPEYGTAGLLAYWPFTAGAGTTAGDRARNGGHHGTLVNDATWADDEPGIRNRASTDNVGQGDYRIAGLLYDDTPTGTLYETTPILENHAFDPATRFARLNDADHVVDDANFTDTTSVTIAGQILFAATSCAVDSVEILIDDIPSALTDAAGRYAIGGVERGPHTIRAIYRDHEFDPEFASLTVNNDIQGLNFSNTTTRVLSGFVAGGECRADIGRARITITTPDGCQTETVTTSDRQYSIELPARDYLVSVEMLDNPTIDFTSTTVDLTDDDQELDFIYYAPPVISLTGFPESSCTNPVLEQGRQYEILARVTEQYPSEICPATGSIEVFDEVADSATPVSEALDETGILRYDLTAGVPNIVGGGPTPYQKKVTFAAAGPGGESIAEQPVVVEGNRPREQTFTTVSPQIPMLILRDPPGDQSYSYKEESQRTCYAAGLSLLADASVGVFSKVRAGTKFETQIFGVSFETKVWGEIGSSLEVGARALSQTEREVCLTHSNRYSTSGNQDITGTEGDVFVGSALNLLYAVTDVLEVDESTPSCPVDISQAIVYDTDGFATQYHYTEEHIRTSVIPALELSRENAADATRRQEFEDQIEVWNQTLALNERLKATAAPMGDDFNLSFSANAPRETFSEWQVTDRESIEFNLYVNSEVAVEAGVEIAGVGASGGVRVRASLDVGSSETVTTTTTNRTGFFLADDDTGDAFTVDVKRDRTYGTPVFELVSGVSSYPWEQGTLPRDGVSLTLSPVTQSLPDATATAEVIATLGNTGQNFETRPYELVFLQESNPAGAIVTIGGSPAVGPVPYSLDDSEARQVTVRLSRSPSSSVYDYDDLQLVLRSPQDGQIADTASFSVHFDSPCTALSMSEPLDGWVVNALSNDSLRVILGDYDRTSLERLRIETSPAGRNSWSPALSVEASNLADNSAILYWKTGSVSDAAYDMRAVAECNIGGTASTTSTARVTGTVDRLGPKLFGAPHPTSGVLSRGGEVSATFNEPINCSSANSQNVLLKDTETGLAIPVDVACADSKVIVDAQQDLTQYENKSLQVTLKDIEDRYGNNMGVPKSWSFTVNRSLVYWASSRVAATVSEGEEADLVARLSNAGTEDESYSLTEFPDWLEPSNARGSVPAGASESIRFTADNSLPLGKYSGRVIATTSQGAEPLRVDLTVACPAPEWNLNPAAFEFSMAVTAGVYLEEVAYSAEGDVLVAYVDGEVRGIAEVQKVFPQDEYAAFLTIYSNAPSGETVDFVMFDASECKERSVSETLAFEAGGVAGTASDLLSLGVSGAVLQSIDLLRGWTWISLGVESSDMSADAVLGELRPVDGDVIKGQTGYSQYVSGAGWVGSLDSLDAGYSYRIQSEESKTLQFIGEPVDAPDHPIELETGWNWIGFLPDNSLNTNEALASIAPSSTTSDIVKGQFAFATFDGSAWVGSLGRLLPGEGYLLHRESAGTLVYPGAAGSPLTRTTRILANTMSSGAPPEWSVQASSFENSMTITASLVLENGFATNPASLVAAFVGDEVRGVARPRYVLDRWVFFLTIYGDAPNEPITFRAYDADRDMVVSVLETVEFEAEGAFGSPRSTYDLTAATATANEFASEGVLESGLDQNYPNPFGARSTIPFALSEAGDVRLEVFDALGRRVSVVANTEMAPGRYSVEIAGNELANGVYLYRLRVGRDVFTRTMTVLH